MDEYRHKQYMENNGKQTFKQSVLMVLCSYDEEDGTSRVHLVVSRDALKSEEGKKKILKYLKDVNDYKNLDEEGRELFDECVDDLFKIGFGYFVEKYYFESVKAIV
jgi:hypothetical protein